MCLLSANVCLLLQQFKSMKNTVIYIWSSTLCSETFSGLSSHALFMQISHVLFMQISHVLQDDCGQKGWNAGQRSLLLDLNINDAGEQTNY